MRIIPRAEWGARHDNGARDRPLPAAHVVLHHSVTIAPDLVPPWDDDYAAIRQLEAIGEQRFGRGISYTRLFTPAGLIFEGHSIGRVGSHTAGYNVTGVGYCLVGNYETSRPTEAQLRAQAWCLRYDHANGWIDAPRIDFPHSAVKSTACPGQHGRAAIPSINQLAAGGPIEEDDMGGEIADAEIQFAQARLAEAGIPKRVADYCWVDPVFYVRRIDVQLAALAGTLADDEANIIAAVRQIVADDTDTEVVLGPEQYEQLLAALPPVVADGLREAFTRAGQETPS